MLTCCEVRFNCKTCTMFKDPNLVFKSKGIKLDFYNERCYNFGYWVALFNYVTSVSLNLFVQSGSSWLSNLVMPISSAFHIALLLIRAIMQGIPTIARTNGGLLKAVGGSRLTGLRSILHVFARTMDLPEKSAATYMAASQEVSN